MSLMIHAFGAYPTFGGGYTNAEFDMNKLVKAVKGEEFKGYANFQLPDRTWRRVEYAHRLRAFEVVACWAGPRLNGLRSARGAALVPVPSSSQVTFDLETSPSLLAKSIAHVAGNGMTVCRALHWRRPMPKSRDSNIRDVAVFVANLVVSDEALPRNVVLVDDVKTSGAHLKAVAQVLRARGCLVRYAVVAGATTQVRVPNPLNVAPEELESEQSSF